MRPGGWTIAAAGRTPRTTLAVVAAIALGVLLVGLALAGPGSAVAADNETSEPTAKPQPRLVSEQTKDTSDWEVTSEEAIEIANRDADVRRHAAANAPRRLMMTVGPYRDHSWEVRYRNLGVEVVMVMVNGETGEVTGSWTGHQTRWRMARGLEGQFGKILNAPVVWGSFALLFLLGLVDFRRLSRMVHLDLLVLLSFGISLAWFNHGDIGVSVPLAYPPLIYLLLRALWLGFGRRSLPLDPWAPTRLLGLAVVFLLVVRIVFNIATSGVIDVGYAGVIGADLMTSGENLYGNFPADNGRGDTYAPLNYVAYIPFELAFPWSGEWDELPAAHALSIFTDLLVVLGLFVLGRRLAPGERVSLKGWRGWAEPGNRLGFILAFAWVAFPFTGYALQSNSNDALLTVPLVWLLVWFSSPVARGLLLGAASMIKFAPLALAPLMAFGRRGLLAGGGFGALWSPVVFVGAFLVAIVLPMIWPLIDPGLDVFIDRTVRSQLDRTSPFSVWGQTDWDTWQSVAKYAVVALGLLVAFVPRRRSLPMIAALAAAVLILQQISLDHWFYLYIPWFLGYYLVAIAAPGRTEPQSSGH